MGSPTYEGFHSYTAHADLVTISTGLRRNFIYDSDLVGGAVRLTLNKSTATSYEVRNLDGDVLASGATSGTTLDIDDSDLTFRGLGPYGWYRVYLFGPDRSDGQWGTAYGDGAFYRVKSSALFPDNPSTSVGAPTTGYDEVARGVMGLGPNRIDATISSFRTWNVKYATATGTSVSYVQPVLGSGVIQIITHVFTGDPSELATPTTSNDAVPWVLRERKTHGGGALTVSVWEGQIDQGAPSNPQTQTFSSGAKSGSHWVYGVTIYNHSPFDRTAVSASGTGTSASATLPIQGFTAGRQKLVFGIAATSTGVAFNSWPTDFSLDAFDLVIVGEQPASPSSRLSVASNVYLDDSATTPLSVSWDTSCDWVMVGWAVCSSSLSTSQQYNSATLSETWYNAYTLPNRPQRKSIALYAPGIGRRTGLVADQVANFTAGTAFSPYNEPSLSRLMSTYVDKELGPFYTAVKAADPDAKVLGWSNVAINGPQEGTFDAFVAANGLDYCDDIDVHVYNGINGDISLARTCLQWLNDALDDVGFTGELWQTEQGFAWQHMGQVYARFSARWTSMLFMMCELYGIPVERNHYWYDVSTGFDDHPTYWLSSFGPGPQGILIRTMVDEIGPRALTAQLDFGDANNHYAGGNWTGSDGSKTVGLMAGSFGLPSVRFATDAASLVVVDCWGNESTVAAVGGFLTPPASEFMTWIRVPSGTSCALVPGDWDWGENRVSLGDLSTDVSSSSVPLARVVDGAYQNQYYNSTSELTNYYAPWSDSSATTSVPKSLALTYDRLVLVDRVLIDCVPVWQKMAAPLDFDIDVLTNAGDWENVYSFTKPASTSFYFTSVGRCRAETYWSQQSTWIIDLPTPTPCKAIRMTVNEVSEGMHESDVWINNGQAGTPRLSIRELKTYGDVKRTVLNIH